MYVSESMNAQSDKLYAERPGWGEGFDYDEGRHLAAYLYARNLAPGLRVLDAGCGEGFGTEYLAEVAASVTGVDYSPEAIDSARRRWSRPGLEFRVKDLVAVEPDGETWDLVVNFQVLEHIDNDLEFLRRLRSCVAPGGRLMLTTPNILQSVSENPCHVREYRPEEFERRIASVFDDFSLLGVYGNEKVREFDRKRAEAVARILRLDPLGLRRLLPEAVVYPIFARLGKLVRRQARAAAGSAPIGPADFEIRGGALAEALDLVAICRV